MPVHPGNAQPETSIQKFDIADTVRAKIREMFKDIIPDDQLNEWLNREVEAFFYDRNSYGKIEPHSSPFAQMVWKQVQEYLVVTLLPGIHKKCDEKIKEFGVEEFADLIAKATLRYEKDFNSNLVNSIASNLPYQISNVISQMKSEGKL